jgi:hypothetical protein
MDEISDLISAKNKKLMIPGNAYEPLALLLASPSDAVSSAAAKAVWASTEGHSKF